MPALSSSAAYEARMRRRAAAVVKIAKWPAIGALIGGGALLISYLVGPSIADQLGASAGGGFARGMAAAQEEVAAVQRRLSISGWGKYR